MIYEMRIYTTIPGRMPNLLARFENDTLKLWEKHGIKQVGFWYVCSKHPSTHHASPLALTAARTLQDHPRRPRRQRSDVPAGVGVNGRSREEVECLLRRPGVAEGQGREREGRGDQCEGVESVPRADEVFGVAVKVVM